MTDNGLNCKLYVTLGCFGRIDDGFVSCSACKSRILLVHQNLYSYNELMDYFDTCNLFDRPLFNFNTVKSFINNMQHKFYKTSIGQSLWLEKEMQLFGKFIVMHRDCGLFIKLESICSDIKEEPVQLEEPTVFITSVSNQKKQQTPAKKPNKLKGSLSRLR